LLSTMRFTTSPVIRISQEQRIQKLEWYLHLLASFTLDSLMNHFQRRMKKDLQGSLRQWYPIDKADLSPDSDTLADMTPSDMLLATKSNTFKRKKRRNRIMPFALDDDDDVSVTNTATFDKNSDYKDTFSETVHNLFT